jgi:predicted ATPase
MLNTLAVSNYRSLRNLVIPLGRLTVLTGPNGSGKSNIYRALRLLADTARGGVVASLSREGGFSSTLWAGPESFSRSVKRGEHTVQGGARSEPVALRMGFAADDFSYAIDLGFPTPSSSAFTFDPEIKTECIWHGPQLRPSAQLVERRGPIVRIRRESGEWETVATDVPRFESMLERIADPQRAAEVLMLREQIRSWRFYDHLRTDVDSPARRTMIGTYTPVLGQDGGDLAAALQTILEIGDAPTLVTAIGDAFPGSELQVRGGEGGLTVFLNQHGLLRPLRAAELSDGTLRYLLWAAALLTPRPPRLMILNEPEASLHPDLLPALARLIGVATQNTQMWVVSHSNRLVAALKQLPGCMSIQLDKELGETKVMEMADLELPSWKWLGR